MSSVSVGGAMKHPGHRPRVCLGCSFQMTAAEFPDRSHPGHDIAVARMYGPDIPGRYARTAARALVNEHLALPARARKR